MHSYEEEHELILPYRGTIHDLGRTISHKEKIVKMYLEGKSYEKIKQETGHSIQAISNYIRGYRRVVLLSENYEEEEISFLTGMSKSLVREYLKIAKENGWKVI